MVAFGFLVVSPSALIAKDIKVGFIDGYSGPPAVYSNDVVDAFKMETDKVNAAGGLFGNKFQIFKRDSKFKVDISLGHVKEYTMRENVDILAGTISSSVALAVSEVAKKEKIPFFCTFAKTENLTGSEGHRYVFGIAENTAMAGKAAAAALVDKPYKKFWIAGDDYEYGHAIADAVWNNLKKLRPDVELMGQTWWKVGEPDFVPYITAIRSAKPDMLILCTGGSGNAPFLKASKATGFADAIPFWLHTSTEHSTLTPLGMEAPEGVLGTSNYHFYYPETPANQQFVKEFMKTYNRYPAVGALYGYLAAHYIIEGYKKAGKIDKEKLIDAIEGMTIDSPVGKVTLRAYDHQAMLPMFLGVTKKVPQYKDFLIATDVTTVPAEDLMPTIEEVRAARAKK
ncbi:MAG: ABC transporter substrate-binding protein [Deltaproteobacteria bacterium]|nr:ABC transporter substrate-binding protein [Deltaproteobacteria bacterium]